MNSFVEFRDEDQQEYQQNSNTSNNSQDNNSNPGGGGGEETSEIQVHQQLASKIIPMHLNSTGNLDQQILDQKKQNFAKDKFNLLFLGILYSFQGLIIGFTEGAVPVILIQEGAKFSQLGLLSFTTYPWSFQMLAAPIFDSYFSNSFGKRKTYLVPLQLVSAVILIAGSFQIDTYIDSQNIIMLFFIGFILEYIYSVQDITVGGWALTLLSQDNVPLASTCQNIGQTLGVTLSFNVYIWLNSPKFLNSILGTSLKNPLITPNSFFMITGFVILLFTLYLTFFKSEKKDDKKEENNHSLCQTLKKFKGFYSNPNLRLFIIFLLLVPLTTAPVDNLTDLILLKEGLSREIMSTLQLFLIPVQLIASVATAGIVRKKREFSGYIGATMIGFLNNIFKYYITVNYQKGVNDTQILELLFINYFIATICGTMQFICSQSFSYRMCDKSAGASYLTMMNSLSNFGGAWTSSLVLFLADFFSLEAQYLVSMVLFVGFFLFYYKKLLKFEKSTPDQWKLALSS